MYHSRLKGSQGEIRVLSLQYGSWESSIRCVMSNVSLNDAPSYCALSYTWGDPKVTSYITVDDTLVSVTRNLENALRHMRHERSALNLWVDALCINQQDTEERNEQVKMMGSIYATASIVMIWIGEADELSDAAFDSMVDILSGRADEVIRAKACSFYMNVGARSWFNRVWIIQELALATNDPTVICGHKSAPWSTFMSTWISIATELFKELGFVRANVVGTESGSDLSPKPLAQIKIDVLDNIRDAIQRRENCSLRQLYIYARTSEATDPKDRIYGLLGMLKEEHRTKFNIDYRRTVSEIFTEAMAHVFATGEGPFFLSSMWIHGGGTRIPDLPTWVLDFSAQTAEKSNHQGSVPFNPPSPMSASGAGAGAKNGEIGADKRTLRVEALFVDSVKQVIKFGSTIDRCIVQLRAVENLASATPSVGSLDDSLRPYFESFRSSEPIWHVLVSGKKHMSGYDPAPASYGQAYDRLIKRDEQSAGCDSSNAHDDGILGEDYLKALGSHLPNRTFFTTSRGLIGIGCPNVRPHDHITIWFGASTAFVTRPNPAPGTECKLVGAAYVGGIMDGEMVDQLYCEDLVDSTTLFVV